MHVMFSGENRLILGLVPCEIGSSFEEIKVTVQFEGDDFDFKLHWFAAQELAKKLNELAKITKTKNDSGK